MYIKFLCGCGMRLLLRSLRAHCVQERRTYSQCLWMSSLISVEVALMCGYSCFTFTRGENDSFRTTKFCRTEREALGVMKRLNLLFPCNQFVSARLSIISFKTDLRKHLRLLLQDAAHQLFRSRNQVRKLVSRSGCQSPASHNGGLDSVPGRRWTQVSLLALGLSPASHHPAVWSPLL